jgi:hypothetical protein
MLFQQSALGWRKVGDALFNRTHYIGFLLSFLVQ